MTSLPDLIQQSSANAWLFIPGAMLLGALHGLEPGHSKTMMAAFIIAIRGTIPQAVLLGIAATISHTAIIWILAPFTLKLGRNWSAERTEPYFQIASGIIILALAVWMFVRIRREQTRAAAHQHHSAGGGPHGGFVISTGHGVVEISVFETGVPPCFRIYFYDLNQRPVKLFGPGDVKLHTLRPDGSKQVFEFMDKGDFLQSTCDIPEPHEFKATLSLAHGDHAHGYETEFVEDDHHHHGDIRQAEGFADAHERAHATDIQKRFANRNVTTGQLIVFGLTGGLLPCPAAVTVLLLCLHLKRYILGFILVLGFSLGLATTLVVVGSVAAWSVGHAVKRFKHFGELARKMPYVSSSVMALIGLVIAFQGLRHLSH